ncbi:MAG: HD domain-containing protein [Thermoguttaceae bacterium]|nr:HD domain-containing protein [Thermoguttaceae bacterium]
MIDRKELTRTLLAAGATDVVMVGGCVRDMLLGIESKDVDMEVYGLSYAQMAKALEGRFPINQVGQSFSVLKVGNEIDLALPRRDSKIGDGHKGFEVTADSSMTFAEAASRRDLTINAIGMRTDGTLVDPYDGAGDLKRGILRAPSDAFCEDPLRVLRAMQFAARFGFTMEAHTVELCKRVLPEFKTLSAERIFGEWLKWATKGKRPEMGLDLLVQTDWITCFPELNALRGIKQHPTFHPEGDAFEHTRLVCAQAAQIAQQDNLSHDDRAILLFAALCHDFGKPIVHSQRDCPHGIAHGHAEAGEPAIVEFLMKMKPPLWLVKNVVPICKAHMYALRATPPSAPSDANIRRLSEYVMPSNIIMWSRLVKADIWGRAVSDCSKLIHDIDIWVNRARELNVELRQPDPLLQGRDLIAMGIKPGPEMGKILKAAWNAQLDGEFLDHAGAVAWYKRYSLQK